MAYAVPPDSTRERVLRAIRTTTPPPTADELATGLGLHRNSVRLHALALEDAGLVVRAPRATGRRGRPQVSYRPTPSGARAGARHYRELAAVLVDHLAATGDAPAAAREAGRDWGHRLAAARRDDPDPVPTVLDELDFEPVDRQSTIELHNCPFRELVDDHGVLVCALHAGMLDGLAERTGNRVELLPFTSPTTCTVQR